MIIPRCVLVMPQSIQKFFGGRDDATNVDVQWQYRDAGDGPGSVSMVQTRPRQRTSRKKKGGEGEKENVTYPFRKQPVTRTESTTVAQTDTPTREARLVVHSNVLLIVADELLKPLHQFGVSAQERGRAVDKDGTVDEVLAEEVAKLQEFVEGVLVADGLLSAIKEA